MTVAEKKAAFVTNELTALIKKIDSGIGGAEYVINQRDEEYVHIYNTYDNVIKEICVTADSLYTIAVDVLKKIE